MSDLGIGGERSAWHEEVLALRAERDALREALRKYGWHIAPCAVTPCTCGFDAALAADVD